MFLKPNHLPNIRKIAPDKWKHFFVGIAMGMIVQVLLQQVLPYHSLLATALTFIIVIGISYGFEVVSLLTGKGHYDVMDAVASTIGGIIGMGLALLISPVFSVIH